MTAIQAPLHQPWTATSTTSLVATAFAMPRIDPIALFGAARAAGLDAALWHEPLSGHSLVGIDVMTRLAPDSPDALDRLGGGWRDLVEKTDVTGPAAGSRLAGPMLLGGAPFRWRTTTDPRWDGFAGAAFDVPRLLVVSHAAETVLTIVRRLDEDGASPGPELLDRLLDGWVEPPQDVSAAPSSIATQPDRSGWGSSVARIAGAVGRGRLDKVVLARRVDLAAPTSLDAIVVLRRLEASELTATDRTTRLPSTLFAFGHGPRTFLGSSPELLASVRGRELRTMALAGTAPRGADAAEDDRIAAELLLSEKDHEEHAVVTAMLRSTLAPVATDVVMPRTPRIVRSTTVQHLVTDVTGTPRWDMGLLGLVARLHPTPAVAGWPREAALELLDEEEDIDRGWYAGPVGWIDRAGDGDMHVAIRSAVIAGSDASLFAGCGIVADSEPDREWEESAIKLRVMGDALGWPAR